MITILMAIILLFLGYLVILSCNVLEASICSKMSS